jgi:hypothetical protein
MRDHMLIMATDASGGTLAVGDGRGRDGLKLLNRAGGQWHAHHAIPILILRAGYLRKEAKYRCDCAMAVTGQRFTVR